MNIYLAARYSRLLEMQECAKKIEMLGGTVTSRWTKGDHQVLDADLMHEAHRDRALQFMREDLEDIEKADAVVFFAEKLRTPTRGGRHFEFGYALARNKLLYLIGSPEHIFHLDEEIVAFETFEKFAASEGYWIGRDVVADGVCHDCD